MDKAEGIKGKQQRAEFANHTVRPPLFTPAEALRFILKRDLLHLQKYDRCEDKKFFKKHQSEQEVEALEELKKTAAPDCDLIHADHFKWRLRLWKETAETSKELREKLEKLYSREELALKLLEIDQATDEGHKKDWVEYKQSTEREELEDDLQRELDEELAN